MIEGVFQVSELCARDIMIPRAQMDAINIAETPEQFIPFMLEKAHSRYPVFESNRDNVIGVLLAKTCCAITTKKNSMSAACCDPPCSFRNRSV